MIWVVDFNHLYRNKIPIPKIPLSVSIWQHAWQIFFHFSVQVVGSSCQCTNEAATEFGVKMNVDQNGSLSFSSKPQHFHLEAAGVRRKNEIQHENILGIIVSFFKQLYSVNFTYHTQPFFEQFKNILLFDRVINPFSQISFRTFLSILTIYSQFFLSADLGNN